MNKHARHHQIYPVALELVQSYGVANLDALPLHLQDAQISEWQRIVRQKTDCAYLTARSNVAKACRRERGRMMQSAVEQQA